MILKKILQDSKKKESIGNKFRKKRFVYFERLISNLPRPIHILDVGGTEDFWVNRGYNKKEDVKITLLNLKTIITNYNNITSIVGDATDLSLFKEDHFDIVFSNSVIEHLHNFKNQQKMAQEVQRVGIYHFIQTPNKYFLIEPHFLFPLFQFLPKSLKYLLLTKTKLSRGKKWNKKFAKEYIQEIRLLSLKEMKYLFPNSKNKTERFLGMSKSYTLHNIN
jgi:ubiquinone/menaquinone biosynthesis C-methylase UbiE